MKTNIYLIRHAEAEGNIYRRLHGHFDSLLTHNGYRQVEALKARFADVPVDAVYSSDLFRTRETAKAITVPKGLPLRTDPRFREIFAGEWENRCFGELMHFEPEEMDRFNHRPEEWKAPGAETYAAFTGRFLAALREAAEEHAGRTIAIFSHGCVISAGLHALLGLPHNPSICDNTGVSLLRWEDGDFALEYLYDNSHLKPEISTRARQRWWWEQGGSFNLWFRDPVPEDREIYAPDYRPPKEQHTGIAVLGDKPVGYVCRDRESLSILYLLPEYRHRRMGDQLLGEAVLHLRAQGVKALNVGIPTVNLEALSFFARHGAEIVQMDDVYTVYRMDIRGPEER